MEKKCAGDVVEGAEGAFGLAVLGRGVGTGHAKVDAMASEKFDQGGVDKFGAIVGLEGDYGEVKLRACIGNEVD